MAKMVYLVYNKNILFVFIGAEENYVKEWLERNKDETIYDEFKRVC
jgi:hypothetical protein